MTVLDANVVSELMRPAPNPSVAAWVRAQERTRITSITVSEVLLGLALMPAGRRRDGLVEVARRLLRDLQRHVLDFDANAAVHYADIVGRRRAAGRPISTEDAQIAAICRAHGMRLATRNTGDFVDTGVELINPWTA